MVSGLRRGCPWGLPGGVAQAVMVRVGNGVRPLRDRRVLHHLLHHRRVLHHPWLRRLSEHTEYLYLAELKVEDVFFALVASAMRLASGCRLPSGLCVWLSP